MTTGSKMSPAAVLRLYNVLHENPHFLVRPLAQVESEAITQAVILCNGDLNIAAVRLGISRATLYRKLRRLDKAEAS